MIRFGLDVLLKDVPVALHKKRGGVLCHAASITSPSMHILDALRENARYPEERP